MSVQFAKYAGNDNNPNINFYLHYNITHVTINVTINLNLLNLINKLKKYY